MAERIVVVGSSVGGIRTGQALRAGGFTGEIVVVGAEDTTPYDKPPLSKEYLAGTKEPGDFPLLTGGWERDGLTPALGRPAVGLDTDRREVELAGGERLRYDHAVLATGGVPRVLTDVAGRPVGHTVGDLAGSTALRRDLDEAARHGGHVVVVGGGFIGCEVAATARRLGCATTVVDPAPVPMHRAVGDVVGDVVARRHIANGTSVLTGVAVDSIIGAGPDRTRVALDNDHELDADVVVAGIGIVPNTGWLAGSGVAAGDGVRADEFGRVPHAPGVYAVGDVARWTDPATGRSHRSGHWTDTVDQAGRVAYNILHPHAPRAHRPAPYFWSDQYGQKIQMIGLVGPDDRVHPYPEAPVGRYVALFSRAGRLGAAVTVGWPRAMATLRRLWADGVSVWQARSELDTLAAAATTSTQAIRDSHPRTRRDAS